MKLFTIIYGTVCSLILCVLAGFVVHEVSPTAGKWIDEKILGKGQQQDQVVENTTATDTEIEVENVARINFATNTIKIEV
ncbi:MAG: hypothetical protein J6Q51_01125 [Clostridia bacterium]|nr:hypothetical protein [Clostridia bacterium]